MNEKLNKMYNLLSEYKFTIISEINEDFKCVICKEILINAYQSLCGCHFCQLCIKDCKNSGSKNCPGNTDECKSEDLANILADPGMNKRISNLVVRCPHKLCSHKCRLIEMEDHMRFCWARNVNCPFANAGCEHEEMNNDKLNEHMLSEIVNHNKILIDLIGNLRNEVQELKERDEKNRKEIEKLKVNDCRKDEKLELLMAEIKLIKKEKEDLVGQIGICDRNSSSGVDKIDVEMSKECNYDDINLINDEMKMLKMENEELSQQVNILKSNFDVEINARLNELKNLSEKFEIQTSESNEINRYLNMRDNGELFWDIGIVCKIDLIISTFFYDRQNPYKMRLKLMNKNNALQIRLYIYSDSFDADLKWPCRANLLIKIFTYDQKFICKSIKESLVVDKPENDSYKCSKPIKLSHSDLNDSDHLFESCCLIGKVGFD